MYGKSDLYRRLIRSGYKTVFILTQQYITILKRFSQIIEIDLCHIQSAIYYFNKWGWFFDKERNKINSDALKKLRHRD